MGVINCNEDWQVNSSHKFVRNVVFISTFMASLKVNHRLYLLLSSISVRFDLFIKDSELGSYIQFLLFLFLFLRQALRTNSGYTVQMSCDNQYVPSLILLIVLLVSSTSNNCTASGKISVLLTK